MPVANYESPFRAKARHVGSWLENYPTGLEFRSKYGLDYGVLMKHEHVNTAAEIESVLRYFFQSVDRAVFGLTASFSFYQFFECRSPFERK